MPYVCGSCRTDLTHFVTEKQTEVGVMVFEGFSSDSAAPTPSPKFQSVSFKCTNAPSCGKLNAFEIAAKDANDTVHGRILDEEESQTYTQLRTYVTPKETGERIDKYVSWLFGGAGTLSTVLALFNSVIPFTTVGKVLLTISIILMVACLLAAASASTLTTKKLNPNNLKALMAHVVERRGKQGSQLWLATLFFAGAILVVGLIPALNLMTGESKHPQLQAGYSYDSKSLTATLNASGLEPFEVIELQVTARNDPTAVVARGRSAAGASGEAQLNLVLDRGDLVRPLAMKSWRSRDGKTEDELLTAIEIPAPSISEQVSYSLENGKLRLGLTVTNLSAPRTYVLEISRDSKNAPHVLAQTRLVLSPTVSTGELRLEKDVELASGALSLVVAREEGSNLVDVFNRTLADSALRVSQVPLTNGAAN
ncbi:hypothetical protein F0U60_39355 [Archangium minus]|uniref:Uncharacterized protein n=1 Tax=Archangium minus TaxID=83450 RepID=A0ABY9X2A2_9BACT|nr:hypothetical protein F0U60_39355 [Archangium minus]